MKYNKKALGKLLKEKGKLLKFWTRGFIPKSDKIPKKTAAIANLLTDEHPPVVVYALFATAADAKNALTLNGAIFEDHRLRVTPANAKKSPSELGVFVGNLPQSTYLNVESVLHRPTDFNFFFTFPIKLCMMLVYEKVKLGIILI